MEAEDPVLLFSDVLEKIVLRAQSWPDAITNLRANIKAVADAERQMAKTMKKIAVASAPVCFAQNAEAAQAGGHADSLMLAANSCFQSAPQHLGVHHDNVANAIMDVYGKTAALDRLAKKHRGAVEAEAQGLWEGVVKARESLVKARKHAESLEGLDEAQLAGVDKDKWLAEVQLIQLREDERDASSLYCSQVLKLSEEAQKHETECSNMIRDVLGAFMAAQSSNLARLDADMGNVARGLKVLDANADWTAFRSQSQMEAVRSGQISTDWRSWNVAATTAALGGKPKEEAMGGVGVGGVIRCGEMHRQGTMLKFNWHKHWFVLTKYGVLHYFPSQSCAIPDESIDLTKVRLEAKIEKEILTLTMTSKSSSWFGSGTTKKIALSGDGLTAWAADLSKFGS